MNGKKALEKYKSLKGQAEVLWKKLAGDLSQEEKKHCLEELEKIRNMMRDLDDNYHSDIFATDTH